MDMGNVLYFLNQSLFFLNVTLSLFLLKKIKKLILLFLSVYSQVAEILQGYKKK